jgi:hypothetical protein
MPNTRSCIAVDLGCGEVQRFVHSVSGPRLRRKRKTEFLMSHKSCPVGGTCHRSNTGAGGFKGIAHPDTYFRNVNNEISVALSTNLWWELPCSV